GAGLDHIAPGALAALHVDPFATAQGIDNGITGARSATNVDGVGGGARRGIGGGQEYDHGSGGYGNAGGEIEKIFAGLAVHDISLRPGLTGPGHPERRLRWPCQLFSVPETASWRKEFREGCGGTCQTVRTAPPPVSWCDNKQSLSERRLNGVRSPE